MSERRRMGPGDSLVLGYSRSWGIGAACAVLGAVGFVQYCCAAGAVGLFTAHHWVPWGLGLGSAAWVGCLAFACFALSWLWRRRRVSLARTAVAGTACCALGLLLASAIASPGAALAVDVVAAGAGGGLACRACLACLSRSPGGPRGVLSCWACAAAPVALAAGLSLGVGVRVGPGQPIVVAWAAVTVAALCAPLLPSSAPITYPVTHGHPIWRDR